MRWLLPALLALVLSACGSAPIKDYADPTLRHSLVLDGLGQIGRPYRYGGSNPNGFDCSGLIYWVYLQNGVRIPRTTTEQHAFGRKIPLRDAEPGDLLFYRFSSGKVDHVAMYLGDGEALHAPATGRQVIVAHVDDPYWERRFVDAVRIIGLR